MITIRALAPEAAQCPFCRSSFSRAERIVRCFQCNTVHHLSCWSDNGSRCSVFHCSSNRHRIAIRSVELQRAITPASTLLLIHLLLNVITHFFINSFAPLVFAFHVTDAVIVVVVEMIFLITGVMILKAYGLRASPVVFFSMLVLSANFLYLAALGFYGLSFGIQSIVALIRL